MLNCLQVKSILCASPEELQDTLNSVLAELGKRVHDVHFFVPLTEGFAANVIYWSQDVPAAITAKCEEYAEENPGTEPIFVAVISESQRVEVYNALVQMVNVLKKEAENAKAEGKSDIYNSVIKEQETYFKLLPRFEPDTEEQPE